MTKSMREKAAYQKTYYEQQKAEMKAKPTAYREAQKEQSSAYKKVYYQQHREQILARVKAYQEKKRRAPLVRMSR